MHGAFGGFLSMSQASFRCLVCLSLCPCRKPFYILIRGIAGCLGSSWLATQHNLLWLVRTESDRGCSFLMTLFKNEETCHKSLSHEDSLPGKLRYRWYRCYLDFILVFLFTSKCVFHLHGAMNSDLLHGKPQIHRWNFSKSESFFTKFRSPRFPWRSLQKSGRWSKAGGNSFTWRLVSLMFTDLRCLAFGAFGGAEIVINFLLKM